MLIIKKHRGHALPDMLVLCCCVVLFVVIATVVCAKPADDVKDANSRHPLSLKDQAQLVKIMEAFTVFTEHHKGRYPIPGLINRKAADLDGDGIGDKHLPAIGPEDIALNTTANLYSAMVIQRYLYLDALISPIERNKKVTVDSDYDFADYNPAMDVYWDSDFAADLAKLSNTSYAHLPIFGQRKLRSWRFNKKSPNPILSNRGPKDGKADPNSNTCGPHGYWNGHVGFSDGHVEFLNPTAPYAVPVIRIEDAKLDNIFAFDDGINGRDTILSFTKLMTEDGPVLQHD